MKQLHIDLAQRLCDARKSSCRRSRHEEYEIQFSEGGTYLATVGRDSRLSVFLSDPMEEALAELATQGFLGAG